MKFNHLNIPESWKQYFTKYPNGLSLLEALVQWTSYVNDMIDVLNTLIANNQAFIDHIVIKVTGKSLVDDTEIAKLATIEENAEANNISDANASGLTDGNVTTLHKHSGSNITNTPSGNISATTVQGAINELDTEKANKLFATNLVTNGGFSNGTTGFSSEQSTLAIVNGEGEITSNTVGGTAYGLTVNNLTLFSNRKYYISYKIKPFRTHIPLFWVGVAIEVGKTVTTGVMTNVSSIFQPTTNRNTLTIYGNRGQTTDLIVGSKVSFDDIIIIDITSIFGANNEPTKLEIDKLLSVYPNSWFNGTSEIGSIGALMIATLGAQVVTPTLLNSRTGTAQYVVSNDGLVIFRGTASGGSLNTNIFVLPENIRPVATRTFPISANNAFGVITVATNGEVRQTVGALTNVFLDGIVFKVGV